MALRRPLRIARSEAATSDPYGYVSLAPATMTTFLVCGLRSPRCAAVRSASSMCIPPVAKEAPAHWLIDVGAPRSDGYFIGNGAVGDAAYSSICLDFGFILQEIGERWVCYHAVSGEDSVAWYCGCCSDISGHESCGCDGSCNHFSVESHS